MEAALIAGVLAFGSLSAGGCAAGQEEFDLSVENEEGKDKPLKVVATLFPYYDFTRQIAGSLIDLEMVVPAGMDSHSFEPTPADMRKIQEADVLICNGGAMEYWVSQVLEAIDREDLTVAVMMDCVETVEEELTEGMESPAHSHGEWDQESLHGHESEDHEEEPEYDEHIWTSPVNAVKCVEAISQALCQADPVHTKEYEAGQKRCQEELLELDGQLRQVAAEKKRNMIIVADKFPFRYLAEEYGFEYRAAFSGCSTDTEPSARTIAFLIDKVKEEQIPVVYYLELSSSRVAEIIGEETKAVPMLLHSCHNVTRAEFEQGITYAELMQRNIESLRKGLDE